MYVLVTNLLGSDLHLNSIFLQPCGQIVLCFKHHERVASDKGHFTALYQEFVASDKRHVAA